MDWQIKNPARVSTLSGKEFTPGDRIVCMVFKDEAAGELGRADLLEHEVESFTPAGEVLGRWMRTVKPPNETAENSRDAVASAEELFLSLQPGVSESGPEEADALRHLLALMLERKRILRVQGPRKGSGSQTYLHVKRKEEYTVPLIEIVPEQLLKIKETLGDLLS
ncbi:MAG: hypothetical protein ACLFUF_00630 [Opitutales bacterium]